MPRDAVRIPHTPARDARTALDEIMAKGRTKKQQERWVVLGGLLMQGKRNLSMRKQGSSPVTMPTKALPSGYHNARPPHLSEPDRKRRKSA